MSQEHFATTLLNQLERDPIVRWGCSWLEIKSAVRKAFLISLIPSVLMGTLFSSFITKFSIFLVLSLLVTAPLTVYFCQKLARLRADKPLFYDLHIGKKKRRQFIESKPYQRERNHA